MAANIGRVLMMAVVRWSRMGTRFAMLKGMARLAISSGRKTAFPTRAGALQRQKVTADIQLFHGAWIPKT